MTHNDQASEQLTPKQELLIELLLSGLNIATAARQLKLGDKTARRWLKLPHFKAAYRSAQHDLFRDAMQELHGLISKAIRTLDRNLSEETDQTIAVRAAKIILDQALAVDKMSELEELQEKVAMLEGLIQT